MEESENIYEDLIDLLINNQPLTSSRFNEFNDAIRMNRQIVDNMHNIRRYLEIDETQDEIQDEEPFNNIDRMINNMFNFRNSNNRDRNIYDITGSGTFTINNNGVSQDITELVRENNFTINQENNFLPNINTSPEFNLQGLFTSDMLSNTMLNSLMSVFLEGGTMVNPQEFEDVKVTLNKDEFESLDCKIISNENFKDYNNKECNICMDEYNVNDVVIHLDCTHIFHKNCIKNWLLKEKVTCPVCRKDIRETLEQ